MNTAVRTVTVIPPSINPLTHLTDTPLYKLRVAAYARVSTDSDEQFTSYEAQIDYYTQYIQRNQEWTFVKVYTDEGISGTNTKHRAGFNEMIEDALAGKIDLIVTKSVSRFARNTVDSLVTIRNSKRKASRSTLKRRTFTPSTARVNCCSPLCRAWRRKKAAPFRRM